MCTCSFRTKSNVLVASVRVELSGVKSNQGPKALPLNILVQAESSRYIFDQKSYNRYGRGCSNALNHTLVTPLSTHGKPLQA